MTFEGSMGVETAPIAGGFTPAPHILYQFVYCYRLNPNLFACIVCY